MYRLVFSDQITKKENLSLKDIDIIAKACKKDIFTKIKGKNIPNNASLVKIYITTIEGARRVALVLDEQINIGYFLLFRKKEDSIGKNISIKNPKFKKILQQYLILLDKDIENNTYKVINLS